MSARPDVPRLTEEELDLLISRFLDGDLSPEEEQKLERLVSLDPAAARRKAELTALVAEMKALPEPAAPFALTTRVTSNVAERAGRPGSLGGRVGFFPAPGFAKAALVILGIVGASIAILRPAPRRLAEGPVDVILYSPARPASPAPESVVAESKPDARMKALVKEKTASDDKERAPEFDQRRRESAKPAEEAAGEKAGEKKAAAKLEGARQNEVAPLADASTVAENAAKQRADRDEGAALDAARPQAPAKVTGASGSLAAAAPPAPAAAPAPARAVAQAAGGPGAAEDGKALRGWTVSVRGDAVRRWALRRAPDNPPPARGAAVYRVTLDASGRVTALSRVGAGTADPRLDAFVRGMVFEPIARPAEVQSRVAAKDAPEASADFEIGLDPR